MADSRRVSVLRAASKDWLSWDLTPRQLDDLELLLNGFYGPLRGFLTRAEYQEVTRDMRLDGTPWPLPVLLTVPTALATKLSAGAMLALRDPEGVMLAVLHVADIWDPDNESTPVGGPRDGFRFLGGRIDGLLPPAPYDFPQLRLSAPAVRAEIARRGWTRVIGFTPRSLLHRADVEGALHLMTATGAAMLVHVAEGKSEDPQYYGRMRCYVMTLARLPPERVLLILSPPGVSRSGPLVLPFLNTSRPLGICPLNPSRPDDNPGYLTNSPACSWR